jgi:hypothetical protein
MVLTISRELPAESADHDMKNLTKLFTQFAIPAFAAAMGLGALGCSHTNATIPDAGIPFARASYKLAGQTSEEECGTYILGLNFGSLFATETGTRTAGGGGILGLFSGGGTLEEQEAIYKALEKIPEATHLLEPRVKNSFVGIGYVSLPFFGKRCATVKSHAVTMGDVNAAQ